MLIAICVRILEYDTLNTQIVVVHQKHIPRREYVQGLAVGLDVHRTVCASVLYPVADLKV